MALHQAAMPRLCNGDRPPAGSKQAGRSTVDTQYFCLIVLLWNRHTQSQHTKLLTLSHISPNPPDMPSTHSQPHYL
jgi:hypothetical protein